MYGVAKYDYRRSDRDKKGGNILMQQQQQENDGCLFLLRRRWAVIVLLAAFGLLLEAFTLIAGLPSSFTNALQLVAGLAVTGAGLLFIQWIAQKLVRLATSPNQTTSQLTVAVMFTFMAAISFLLGVDPWYTGHRPPPPNSFFFVMDMPTGCATSLLSEVERA